MPFGVVGRLGSRIRQVNGGDHPTGRAILGEGERGVFSSGVGPEIGVLDRGSDLSWERQGCGFFIAHSFALHFGVHWKLFNSFVSS